MGKAVNTNRLDHPGPQDRRNYAKDLYVRKIRNIGLINWQRIVVGKSRRHRQRYRQSAIQLNGIVFTKLLVKAEVSRYQWIIPYWNNNRIPGANVSSDVEDKGFRAFH